VFGLGLGRVRDSIKEGFVEAYRVPSAAMSETIQLGDWLYVDKREAGRIAPTRNALILYRSPDDGTPAVKRVVGIAGDTLRMRNDTLYRSDEPVREPYAHVLANDRVNPADNSLERMRTWGPVIVARGTVFVLGDNRHASKDSRYVGLIPLDSVVGTPSVVYYSYDPEGDWPLPALTAIRWQRLGMRLR
jgi:signal peptidase I